jgi:hypothetical protein
MPELHVCTYCKKTINEAAQQFVVTNKQESTFPTDWRYAHAECYEKEQAKNPTAA